jgi:hypothetical protein
MGPSAAVFAPSGSGIGRSIPTPELGELIRPAHHVLDTPELQKKGHVVTLKSGHLDVRRHR